MECIPADSVTGTDFEDVAVMGTQAWVTPATGSNITIFDLSDRTNIIQALQTVFGTPVGVTIQNHQAYVLDDGTPGVIVTG